MDFFENAGKKLKSILNKVFLGIVILHIIAAVIFFFICLINDNFLMWILIVLGLALSVGACWLAMLVTATFADLAIDTQMIRTELEARNSTHTVKKTITRTTHTTQPKTVATPAAPQPSASSAAQAPQTTPAQAAQTVNCPSCGKSQFSSNSKCFYCGTPLK